MEGLDPGVIAQVVCSLTLSLSVRVQANNKKDLQGSHYLTTEAVFARIRACWATDLLGPEL